jgi:hypothetical protein
MRSHTHTRQKAPVNSDIDRALHSCGSPVCSLLHVTLRAPRNWRWLLCFWKIRGPLLVNSGKSDGRFCLNMSLSLPRWMAGQWLERATKISSRHLKLRNKTNKCARTKYVYIVVYIYIYIYIYTFVRLYILYTCICWIYYIRLNIPLMHGYWTY